MPPDPNPATHGLPAHTPTTADLRRLAHHEAAHAVIGADFGMPVHAVSIRPGRSHAGIAITDNPEAHRALGRLIDGRHPLDGLPPEAFRHACRSMVQVLAGDAAADIAAPPTGRVADPLDDFATEPAPTVTSQAPVQLPARLVAAEAATDGHDDRAVSVEMAYQLVGYQTTGPLLGWLRAEARRAVSDRWPVIESVASALLAAEVLDADAFGRIYSPPEETE